MQYGRYASVYQPDDENKAGSRIVFVGDKDQLESVGPGNVFKELIDSGVIPVTV